MSEDTKNTCVTVAATRYAHRWVLAVQMYGRNLLFNISTYANSQDSLIDGLLHLGTVNDVTFDGVTAVSGRLL